MQEIRLAYNAPRLGHRRTACRERRRRAPEPRRLAGASLFQADRGQRLHGPWLRGPASHDANGIRRPRRAGPIRRPLCYERATGPARSWPRGRKRESYEQNIKIQRLRTSANRRLLPPIPPRRANSNRCARACCMRRSQAGESSKIICSARADSM